MKVTMLDSQHLIYEGRGLEVKLPTEDGELGLLDFHAPLVTLLVKGIVFVDGKGYRIRGGIARMRKNELTILTEG